MTSNSLFTYTKMLLWGVAVALLTQIFFSAQARAQEVTVTPTSAQQVDMLSERLSQLGEVISRSVRISDADRLELFEQLLSLSRALDAVRARILTQERRIDTAMMTRVSPGDVVLPTDIGLQHIAVDLDFDTFTAVVTEYYQAAGGTYDTNVTQYRLTRDPSFAASDFLAQLPWAQEQLFALLSERTGIDPDNLIAITSTSATNPAVAQRTISAEGLQQQFGQYSRVRTVVFSFTHGIEGESGRDGTIAVPATATITFFSDQNERLDVTIVTDGLGTYRHISDSGRVSQTTSIEKKYDITATLAVSHNNRTVVTDTEESDDVFYPELIEYLDEFFENQNFLQNIDGGMQAFISFLLENTGELQIRDVFGVDQYSGRRCVSPVDVAVVDQLVATSLPLMGLQATFPAVRVDYVTPVRENEDNYIGVCVDVSRHF